MAKYTCDCCEKDNLKHKDIKEVCNECFGLLTSNQHSEEVQINSPAVVGEQMTADKVQQLNIQGGK